MTAAAIRSLSGSIRDLPAPVIRCETGCGERYTGRRGASYAQAWARALADGWRTDAIGRRVAPRCARVWLSLHGRAVVRDVAEPLPALPPGTAPETDGTVTLALGWVAPPDPEDRPDLPEPTEVYRWRPDYLPSPEPPAADATEVIGPVDPADYLGAVPPADDAPGHRKPQRRHWWQRGTA